MPKLLSSLAKRVPRPSNTAALIMHETRHAGEGKGRPSARAKVRGKGQAKVRTMGPGPELG